LLIIYRSRIIRGALARPLDGPPTASGTQRPSVTRNVDHPRLDNETPLDRLDHDHPLSDENRPTRRQRVNVGHRSTAARRNHVGEKELLQLYNRLSGRAPPPSPLAAMMLQPRRCAALPVRPGTRRTTQAATAVRNTRFGRMTTAEAVVAGFRVHIRPLLRMIVAALGGNSSRQQQRPHIIAVPAGGFCIVGQRPHMHSHLRHHTHAAWRLDAE
jgi:hypothetical protein